jgi:hypothetical protein
MKQVNQVWVPVLDEAIRTSIGRFLSENGEDLLADLYIYADDDYVIHFYDDMERKLHSIRLDKESEDKSSKFGKQLSHSLQHALQNLEEKKFFDKEFIFKPFTVSLIDKDFIVIEELIFVDDNTIKLNGELLAGLDDELNSFFKDLMEK